MKFQMAYKNQCIKVMGDIINPKKGLKVIETVTNALDTSKSKSVLSELDSRLGEKIVVEKL